MSEQPEPTDFDIPELPGAEEGDREQIALWMKARFEKIEADNAEREMILRTAGDHPSPIFGKMVRRLAGLLGMSAKTQIARMLDISVDILNRFYIEDLELGIAEVNVAVAGTMLQIATDQHNPSAASAGMKWLERRGGNDWKPPAKKLILGKEDEKSAVIDSSKLTFEQRQQMRAMINYVQEGGEGEPLQPGEDEPLI